MVDAGVLRRRRRPLPLRQRAGRRDGLRVAAATPTASPCTPASPTAMTDAAVAPLPSAWRSTSRRPAGRSTPPSPGAAPAPTPSAGPATARPIHHARRALRLLDELGPDGQPDGGDDPAAGPDQPRRRPAGDPPRQRRAARRRRRGPARGVGARRPRPARACSTSWRSAAMHERGEFVGPPRRSPSAGRRRREAAGDELSAAFARQFLGATLVWRGELAAGCRRARAGGAELARTDGVPATVGARAVGAMWSLLGLAACFADEPDEADAAARPGRGRSSRRRTATAAASSPPPAAMADQLADRSGAVRAGGRAGVVAGRWTSAATSGSAGPRRCSAGRSPPTTRRPAWR